MLLHSAVACGSPTTKQLTHTDLPIQSQPVLQPQEFLVAFPELLFVLFERATRDISAYTVYHEEPFFRSSFPTLHGKVNYRLGLISSEAVKYTERAFENFLRVSHV